MKEVKVANCTFMMEQSVYDINKITVDGVDLPMPSEVPIELNDVDLDSYTNLDGYTVRNRIRTDVNSISISYSVLNGVEYNQLLNISDKVWHQVEYYDDKIGDRVTRKMYRSPLSATRYYLTNSLIESYYTNISFSFVEE